MDCLPVLFFASPKMPETFLILCSQILLPYFLHLYHLYLSLHCEIPHQVLTFARDFMGFQYETAGSRRFDLGCLVHLVRIQVAGSPGRRVTALPGGKCRPRSPSSEAPHFEGKEMMRRCYDCYVCYVYVCIIYIQFYIVFMYVCIYICLYYCMLACMSKSCLVPWRVSVRCHARKRTKSSQFLPQPVEHDSMTTTTK